MTAHTRIERFFWIGFFLLMATGLDAQKNGNVRDLPPVLSLMLTNSYPSWEVIRVDPGEHNDRPILKVKLKSKEKDPERETQIRAYKDGLVYNIEEEIILTDLPEDVRKAVQKTFPKSKIEKIVRESEIRTYYQIETKEGRKNRELKVTHHGRVLEIE